MIQNLLRSAALGEPVQRAPSRSRIRRLAFFGQLREGKGIRVFLESLRRKELVEPAGVSSHRRSAVALLGFGP